MKRILCALLLLAGAPLHAATLEQTLSNGLKVIVREDHRAPVVVTQVWYKVGSSYEPGGLTGASHVLEHMMFKGTTRLGPNEFSRIIAENGGEENAFTGSDYTAYFQTLAADRLEVSMRLEADRMRNLRLDAGEFAKELEVVKEERRLRTDDQPQSLLYEQFNATAYLAHPYRNPVIGWEDDLATLTVSDLKDWYQRWYQPSNATLVVVGDVDPKQVFSLARRYFGGLPGGRVTAPKRQTEPPQRGERRLELKAPAQVPYLIMGYHAPAADSDADHWEPYALEVLAGVLDGGESARLASRLRRGQEIAASVGAGYRAFSRAPGMFLLEATPAPGHSPLELEQALRAELRMLGETPVAEDELDRVKAQVVAAEVFQRDSVFYQAMQIGMLETIGIGWQVGEDYARRIRAVTATQVQQVALRYLGQDKLTVGILRPQAGALPSRRPAVSGGRHDVAQ
ncbi:M16 family metallopeptidase [Immundisolibacter sp.]|uniref:M16 family metallopeptidase n=1 Tax=Immundisolibacter sp. TaxID=1934948 RepID=UPI003564D488